MSSREEALKKFGSNIRRIRLSRSLSQEALAEAAGLHRTYVGAAERGERNVALMNMLLIAKALNCSIVELVEGADEA